MLTEYRSAGLAKKEHLPKRETIAQEPKSRMGFKDLAYRIFYRLFFTAEQLLGATAVFLFMRPIALIDLARRWRQFPEFKRLRGVAPKSFWQGVSARRHYLKMVFDWHEFMGVSLLQGRFATPYWRKRVTVRGEWPFAQPGWEKRPIMIAVMHTGPYAFTRAWLRSYGMRAASYIGGLPPILDHPIVKEMEAKAERARGLENVPSYFRSSNSLRDVIRFLKPGSVLGIALDGGNPSPESDRQETGDFPIFVKKSACRIAGQLGAVMYPSSVKRTGFCRYEIRFGRPVPEELLLKEDLTEATHHLVTELWRDIRANPDDLTWSTLEAFPPTFAERQQVLDERPRTWP